MKQFIASATHTHPLATNIRTIFSFAYYTNVSIVHRDIEISTLVLIFLLNYFFQMVFLSKTIYK